MIAKSPVPVRRSLMPVGKSRPATKRSGLLGVTIHNTGNYSVGANAEMHRRYQHGSGADNYTSYHYVVDDKEIIQLIPEDEISWHAGDGANGKGNNQTISIEICVNKDGDIRKATDNAVWLTADILWRNKIPHARIYQHFDWSKKNCPMEIRRGNPYSFKVFVDKVNEYLFPKPSPKPTELKVEVVSPKTEKVEVITYKDVVKKPFMKLKKDVSMWAFNETNWNDIKPATKQTYRKGQELELADIVTNKLGSRYGRTPYSSVNGLYNGFNVADFDIIWK